MRTRTPPSQFVTPIVKTPPICVTTRRTQGDAWPEKYPPHASTRFCPSPATGRNKGPYLARKKYTHTPPSTSPLHPPGAAASGPPARYRMDPMPRAPIRFATLSSARPSSRSKPEDAAAAPKPAALRQPSNSAPRACRKMDVFPLYRALFPRTPRCAGGLALRGRDPPRRGARAGGSHDVAGHGRARWPGSRHRVSQAGEGEGEQAQHTLLASGIKRFLDVVRVADNVTVMATLRRRKVLNAWFESSHELREHRACHIRDRDSGGVGRPCLGSTGSARSGNPALFGCGSRFGELGLSRESRWSAG